MVKKNDIFCTASAVVVVIFILIINLHSTRANNLFGAADSFMNEGQYDTFGDNVHINPRINNWYAVSDWEVGVCTQYGGIKSAYDKNSIAVGGSTNLYDIATIQASKKKSYIEKDTWTYEFAWHFLPFSEAKQVIITAEGRSGKQEIAARNADINRGDSGFEILQDSKLEFDKMILSTDKDDLFTVPIVEKKE